MMSLRRSGTAHYLIRHLRHLASKPGTKVKNKREDIHRYNKQSMVVYGPLLDSKPRKRNYKPIHYRDSKTEETLDSLIDIETDDGNLLPVLNIDFRDRSELLDLNELLAQPLIPGQGVDPEICRIHGDRIQTTLRVAKLPSVTAILDKTMSKKNRDMLERWKKKQIELLGLDGFNQMQQETLATGHHFHACVHDFLEGQSEEELSMTSEVRDGLWSSVRHVLDDVTGVRYLEERLSHQGLLYSGIVDCVAEYNGTLCVIDWKTSKKVKKSLRQAYDNPVQLAAYAGAINASKDMKIRQGALVYAYPDGVPADVISVSGSKLQEYWSLWLQRLQAYWKMQIQDDK